MSHCGSTTAIDERRQIGRNLWALRGEVNIRSRAVNLAKTDANSRDCAVAAFA
jgi:hypothetical protein